MIWSYNMKNVKNTFLKIHRLKWCPKVNVCIKNKPHLFQYFYFVKTFMKVTGSLFFMSQNLKLAMACMSFDPGLRYDLMLVNWAKFKIGLGNNNVYHSGYIEISSTQDGTLPLLMVRSGNYLPIWFWCCWHQMEVGRNRRTVCMSRYSK